MKKHLANIVTGIRMAGSIWMLCSPVFSPAFYGAYLLCGFTDMIDGSIARKTKSVTAFGARLDSVADLIFVAVAFIKILPAIRVPAWLWIWMLVIAAIKAVNVGLGWLQQRQVIFAHTVMNKVTGFLVFLLPLTLSFVELKVSANVVCLVATFSAVQEGFCIRAGHTRT